MKSFKRKFNKQLIISFRYKHTKIEFDKRLENILSRITNLRQKIVTLNKNVNVRNGHIVKNISNKIEQNIYEEIDFEELARYEQE